MNKLIAALAALLLVPGAAAAEERILDFDSRIAVKTDGSLDVTETIHVMVENQAINHGIYRDFPTRYDGRHGKRVRVGFKLVETRLDGQPEPAATESIANGVRVKIGSADRLVAKGEHRYTIRYRATRMIGRFDGFDELYWNVTGNGWAFPIDHAAATIALPSPAKFGQRAVYTGPQGSSGSAARVTAEQPGTIRIETTGPLAPREGLTVAVAFPSGVIAAPDEATKLGWLLSDWAPPLAALAGLLALIAYLFHAWRKAGRDPRPGTVVPLFSPPDGLSPAAMRYVTRQGFDNRAFAAALVDAAVKGHVRLVEEKAGLFGSVKRRLDRLMLSPTEPLPQPERGALNRLVADGQSIVMEQENHEDFAAAIELMSEEFDDRFVGTMFRRNYGWAAAALLVWAAGLWVTSAAILASEQAGNLPMLTLSCGGLLVAAMLYTAAPNDGSGLRWLLLVVAGIIGVAAVALGLPAIPQAIETGRWVPLLIALAGLPLALTSFAWISAPTPDGRKLLDRIAGFKHYLSITEGDRLNRMQAPEESLALFEKYLPYAIALKVENRWADRFAATLAAAAAAPGGASGFHWYSGSSDPWSNSGGFVGSIGQSLASTIASSASAPGSSSGSGGGGSSGGGGGGGGGGGW